MKKLSDIFVTFETQDLEKMQVSLAEWCEYGGDIYEYLEEARHDPSDLYEQFKYLMEVREVAIAGRL